MSLKFFDKLSQNFIEFVNDKDDYDVIIEVENKKKSFTAHSNVLKYRSSYFRQELENIPPNENNIKIITTPSISSEICDIILKYIYANEFELTELSNKLETILIEDKASWLKTHFSLAYRTIFVKESFKDLENFCNDIVVKYPNLIFDSSDFTSLPESALISLIKRDDLKMKEVEIWDYIIKWGISQNPTLPTNPEDWIKENFLTLKTTLQQFLPHIRYFHIRNIEIYDKVRPYKKILDKQLWEDINQHLVAPDRPIKSNILPARSVLVTELPPRTTDHFSNIISEDHAAEISSWIDRKTATYSTTNVPYKFELILCGTRDAWDGNYDEWMETKDIKDTKKAIINSCKEDQKFHGPYFGFGFGFRSKEFNFNLDCLNCCDNWNEYYEKRIKTSSDSFSIDNYEVFKVIRKS
ncbi:hypothetical protein Glove_33g16 [Diversispora epigaea]|uniref:BTB domain-containing protein n=1 Tax=Diversispora epigaea TaxID=1348612 RepID=A0A397JT28_9GLOM|nr:hypothetical protein Glove_33g16 [Diversispora epigaea]